MNTQQDSQTLYPAISMKAILFFLALGVSKAFAAPFLICDTNPLNSDPALNVATYIVTGLSANPISVQATTDGQGGQFLHYDLVTLPNGHYTVTAAAVNAFGESSNDSAPLTFTKGAPSTPTNLRISPQ